MIKAAFFDVDGTLVSYKTHSVPDSTLKVLHELKKRGVKLFLSTGRNGDSTRFLMESGLFDGEILLSGQLCLMDGQRVFENPMAAQDVEAAIAAAQRKEYVLGFLSGNESFVTGVNEYVTAACSYAGMPQPRVESATLAREYPIYQIHCYGPSGTEEKLLACADKLTAVRWSPNFADVFPLGGGKDRGICAICKALGIAPEETIAFGDGENDISMLEYAGIGVAMGNAGETVKLHADFVTQTVDDDGIAFAFERFEEKFPPLR